jgi:hypothetical protein
MDSMTDWRFSAKIPRLISFLNETSIHTDQKCWYHSAKSSSDRWICGASKCFNWEFD